MQRSILEDASWFLSYDRKKRSMKALNPHVIWASVVIIFLLIAGAVLLVLNDKDVNTILTLTAIVALPVLTALGVANYQKSQEVKEIANGNTDRQHKMITDLQADVRELALKVQPVPPPSSLVEFPDGRFTTNIQLSPDP